ncbi:MAG: hypothetical protein CBC24_09450 [Candidatus Pelagibacter sp. TMED64]|nr:MAG: hypothetical protein CBC24_09450 [Candidatus Pelagibacter sp. TMED64]
MKTLWVLLIFLGDIQQDEVYTNDLDLCLQLQQKVLMQNQMQLIAGNMRLHAWCIPKKVKDSK